ncbi:hypothetical protein LTR15_005973 [Elasticomyces elasticus]|nr:hypothetical protein LTR15_005973 [Elasticomyces elasticus]
MSSGPGYTSLPGTIDPQQMCGDAASGVVSTEWYAPSSSVCLPLLGYALASSTASPMSTIKIEPGTDYAQYIYNDQYITPYPSSTVESQPWPAYSRASVPDISGSSYMFQQQHTHPLYTQHQQFPAHFKDPTRPRSSPSTFGPSADTVAWPTTSSGLGIEYTSTAGQPTPPVSSAFPPTVFHYPLGEQYANSTASPPEIRHPQPRRSYTTIAPTPISLVSVKRQRDDDERTESSSSTKRRKRTSSVASADMTEDDRFLVQLKEDESLPWKDIAIRFQKDKGKSFQVAALQMRYKRLREKYRVWEEQDLSALKLAHEYWDKYKWEIISSKMVDFNINERWPARHCARKWQELDTMAVAQPTTSMGMTPGVSQFSSPTDANLHFAFMPIQ